MNTPQTQAQDKTDEQVVPANQIAVQEPAAKKEYQTPKLDVLGTLPRTTQVSV